MSDNTLAQLERVRKAAVDVLHMADASDCLFFCAENEQHGEWDDDTGHRNNCPQRVLHVALADLSPTKD